MLHFVLCADGIFICAFSSSVLGNRTFREQLLAFAADRDQLDETSVRDRLVAQAPPPEPPEPVTTVPPPPQEWLDAATPAKIGARCRVHECGLWHAAVVTKIEEIPGRGMWVTTIYDHNGREDCVEEWSPDIVCEPHWSACWAQWDSSDTNGDDFFMTH